MAGTVGSMGKARGKQGGAQLRHRHWGQTRPLPPRVGTWETAATICSFCPGPRGTLDSSAPISGVSTPDTLPSPFGHLILQEPGPVPPLRWSGSSHSRAPGTAVPPLGHVPVTLLAFPRTGSTRACPEHCGEGGLRTGKAPGTGTGTGNLPPAWGWLCQVGGAAGDNCQHGVPRDSPAVRKRFHRYRSLSSPLFLKWPLSACGLQARMRKSLSGLPKRSWLGHPRAARWGVLFLQP